MKNNASLIYSFCLVVGDFLALVAAFVGAYILRVKLAVGISDQTLGPVNARTYIGVFLLVLPFWILIFALLGLYNHNIYEKRFTELGRLLIGSFIGLMLVIFWNFLADKPIFPARLIPIYGFAFGFLFLVIFRNLARIIRTQLFRHDSGLTRVVLVGNTGMTRELVDWLADSKRSGYKIVGVVGGKRSLGKHETMPLYYSFDQFLKSYSGDLHSIVQTELYADETKNAKILTFAQENHVSFRFVPGNTELFTGNIEGRIVPQQCASNYRPPNRPVWLGAGSQTAIGHLLGGLIFILASPLMLIIIVAQKISEPHGSIFYKPKRLDDLVAQSKFINSALCIRHTAT
jgi:FlaA1/EpsC-like NDP-sugar epimerase